MAYLSIFTAYNLEAQGVNFDGTGSGNSYVLDAIKGPVQIKFNKAIYSTYNNGTQQIFIPANTYVNMVKEITTTHPGRYIYSARTTTSVSNYKFPVQTVTYTINIPDLATSSVFTGQTTVGSTPTNYVFLSATTTSTIAKPTQVRTVTFNSAATKYSCYFTLNTDGDTMSGYQIYEGRHMDQYSASTYCYSREMAQSIYFYDKSSTNKIKFFTPYSANTFVISRMGEDIAEHTIRFKGTSFTGTTGYSLTDLTNTSKSTVLTNKLFKKAYPRLYESSFVFGWADYDDGETFICGRNGQFINQIEANQYRVLTLTEPDSTLYAVRCFEMYGTCQGTHPATSEYGSVINTQSGFISIPSAYSTITFQGNQNGFVCFPFVSGMNNEIDVKFSGNNSTVISALASDYLIENGYITISMGISINENSKTFMTVSAASTRYSSSKSFQTITIITEKQTCPDCDYCNYTNCQYT